MKAKYPTYRRAIGRAIRQQREANGWSQEKLAELADCHRNYVGRIERGEQNASIDTLFRMAEALDCSLGDLVK